MRFVQSIVALLLIAAWPAITSHSLLEHAGLIHHTPSEQGTEFHYHADGSSHEHSSAEHDFADGGYFAKTSMNSKAPRALAALVTPAIWVAADFTNAEIQCNGWCGPAPPGVAPLELIQSRNFLQRAAVMARAPSFLC